MDSKPAPDYSNIFMARRIDPFIKAKEKKYTEENIPLPLLKGFFGWFIGSIYRINQELTQIHKLK